VDTLYNTQLVLDKYRKLQTVPMNNEELVAFKSKVEHFCSKTKNWSKKSQKSSATWQQGTATKNDATRWPLDPFQRQGQSVVLGEENGRWLWNNSKVFH
jgi:hypothetical protein